MKVYLRTIEDVLGNIYIGVVYETYELHSYLEKWYASFKSEAEVIQLKTFIYNKNQRDGEKYHSTICNVMDFNKLSLTSKKYILDKIGTEHDIKILGIGKASNSKGNKTNFIVIESESLQEIRQMIGLDKMDFHITLGFDKKDVFGVSKGEDSIYIKL